MAKLIRINADNTRDVIHDVPGVGTSQRRKHVFNANAEEFFAVRVLKRPEGQDQTEYYTELSRVEAEALYADLDAYLGKDVSRWERTREAYRARFGTKS